MTRAFYWITDRLGWTFVSLSGVVDNEHLSPPLYDLGNWFYGVRP